MTIIKNSSIFYKKRCKNLLLVNFMYFNFITQPFKGLPHTTQSSITSHFYEQSSKFWGSTVLKMQTASLKKCGD